jgi:hypothetical protein
MVSAMVNNGSQPITTGHNDQQNSATHSDRVRGISVDMSKITQPKRKLDHFCRTFANDVDFFGKWRAHIEDDPEIFAVRSIMTNRYGLNKAGREFTGQVLPMLPWGDAAGRLCAGELRRVEDAHSRAMKTGERADLSYWIRLGVTYEPTRVEETTVFEECRQCRRHCAVLLSRIRLAGEGMED